MNAPKPVADTALDALAEALVPRLLRMLKERAGPDDAGLADLLAGAGFELDDSATPAPVERVKRAPSGRRSA